MEHLLYYNRCSISTLGSLVAQMEKHLSAVQETWVRFLGWEDPLEKGMATTPVFLPGESHGQRSLAGYSPRGCKESDTTEPLTLTLFYSNYYAMFIAAQVLSIIKQILKLYKL